MRRERHNSTRESGFTLVELMIVMLVIGVLTAIAIPLFAAAIRNAKEAALKEDLHVIRDAIDSYIAPGSDQPMRRTDRAGHVCHWILEVHLVDIGAQIGGFFEELLDLGHVPPPPGT